MIRAPAIGLTLLVLAGVAQAGTTVDARIDVAVRIAPSAEGVVAQYELSRPVAELILEYGSGGAGRGAWAVMTPGLSYEMGRIQSANGALFSRFEIAAPVRNELSGPYYPCVMGIGPAGRVIYASCFAAPAGIPHDNCVRVS